MKNSEKRINELTDYLKELSLKDSYSEEEIKVLVFKIKEAYPSLKCSVFEKENITVRDIITLLDELEQFTNNLESLRKIKLN